jgi:hypothetical protein
MDNFNFKKYLTENRLGSFGRFNGYTDLQPVNEDGSWHPDDPSAPHDDKEYCDGCDMPKDKCVCDQLEEEDQDMNITTKPKKIYATNEDWMTSNMNGERYDDWVAHWDDTPGIITWHHNQIPTEKLYVAITPGWDGPGTPMETIFNAGDDFGEFDSIEEYEFNSFQDYLQAVKFYLDKIDDNIHNNKYKLKYNISLDDQKTSGQNTHGNDREFNYDDKVYEDGSKSPMNEIKQLQKIAGIIKESTHDNNAWDMANKLAQEKFGEFGFATLSEDQMAEIVNIQKANKLAEDYYGEFGIATLSEDQMEAIFEKHPDILNTDIKEAKNSSFNVELSYNDYPSISDFEQRNAVRQFTKLVKSLGGTATKINDQFSEIDFEVSGISSFEELESEYTKASEEDYGDFAILGSWLLKPKEGQADKSSVKTSGPGTDDPAYNKAKEYFEMAIDDMNELDFEEIMLAFDELVDDPNADTSDIFSMLTGELLQKSKTGAKKLKTGIAIMKNAGFENDDITGLFDDLYDPDNL